MELNTVEYFDQNNSLPNQWNRKPPAWLAEAVNNSLMFEKSEKVEEDLFER